MYKNKWWQNSVLKACSLEIKAIDLMFTDKEYLIITFIDYYQDLSERSCEIKRRQSNFKNSYTK